MADGRKEGPDSIFSTGRITALCSRTDGFRAADGRTGSDGLVILRDVPGFDFGMDFYNPDGSGGMMCGNGGRCIVAFASFLGITPSDGKTYRFLAPDGPHTGIILSSDAGRMIVRISMRDARGAREVLGGWFIDTGTRHFVRFVDDVETVDVEAEGPVYRHAAEFAPAGANVNFVSPGGTDGSIKVRTFEKGVEAETLACGTGMIASAIVSYLRGSDAVEDGAYIHTRIQARAARLEVDFTASSDPDSPARDIFLTGPADLIR